MKACFEKHKYQYESDDGRGLSKFSVDLNLYSCIKHKKSIVTAFFVLVYLNTVGLPMSLYRWIKNRKKRI